MKRLHLIILPVVTLFGGCASDSKIEREPPAPLPSFTAEAEVSELWSVRVGWSGANRGLKLSPQLDGDVLYAADHKGWVSAFDSTTGKRLWETGLDMPVSGAVGVGEDVVVLGNSKGQVVALDKRTGAKLWETEVSSEILAPAAVHAGVAVVQSVDGKVVGLSTADGKRLWLHERSEPALSLRGTSRPVIAGDQVLTGFASGKIVALGLRDGRLLWEFVVAQPRGRNEIERLVDVDVAPLLVGEALFAVSYQGKIIAVELRTGRVAWSRDMSSFTGIDVDRSNIYLTDEKGQVLALDLRTGASVWKQDRLRARQLNAPVLAEGYIVVGDFEGYVHWLSRDDGHFVARQRVGGDAIRARAITGTQALYVANEDGTLAALRVVAK
jgi:outer membrane protein assembly factor BamB